MVTIISLLDYKGQIIINRPQHTLHIIHSPHMNTVSVCFCYNYLNKGADSFFGY